MPIYASGKQAGNRDDKLFGLPVALERFKKLALRFFRGASGRFFIGGRVSKGHLEKPVSLAFRGALRDLSIGGRVNHQRLTLQLIMSLPPNPHPIEVFRCAQQSIAVGSGRFIHSPEPPSRWGFSKCPPGSIG